MKWFAIGCFITILMVTSDSFSQESDIYAVVDGNNVTLWETGAYRNCGALYLMEIDLVDHHIDWYQVDTGLAAYCYCLFDLSVTYGPLEPGDYSVNVYYTESYTDDTIFDGTTGFSIGNKNREITSGIISQYQSDCYTGITDPEKDNNDFRIFPVPVRGGGIVHIEALSVNESAILEIFSVGSKLIFSRYYDGVQAFRDEWMTNELFPVSGLYFVRLRTVDKVYVRKISVF
jgi:hypothetical protein